MAGEEGVTEAVLRSKITEELQATHVEIEDMSGMYSLASQITPPRPLQHLLPTLLFSYHARNAVQMAFTDGMKVDAARHTLRS